MSDKLDRFVGLMKGIFELDKSDLDFGIYRIMNIRKDEIQKFLSDGLPKKVEETLAPFANNTGDIEKRIVEIEKTCNDVGVDVSNSKMAEEYNQLKAQLVSGVDMSALEADVYSALYNFFNRYYDEGDFISKRRYKEGVYAIPYEGEEVKLYWANQDQYYIKTSENFKDYTFKADDYTVHFRIVDATTEQNNNKESDDSKRQFMLYTENDDFPEIKTFEFNEENKELIIRFIFDVPEDKKRKYKEENYKASHDFIYSNRLPMWQTLLAPIPTGKGKDTTTLLEKHLNAYVAKNTFDYFIHKDLKGFLNRELDFYIKSEIMHLDDLDTSNEKRVETYIAKIKAIKRVGHIIIDFLAQIENFQKKLWLKKKFVIETNWCITLDRIDKSFYPEIIENEKQIQEWIDMYAVDEIEQTLDTVGFTNPPTVDFLRENSNLVIDTKNFTNDFKERLVASIEDIDEKTNGLMINSDNFQALNLLRENYNNKVDGIYIDPPYNTESDRMTGKFVYKDSYEHSSWCAMMYDRLLYSQKLQTEKSSVYASINEDELYNLKFLMEQIFDKYLTSIAVKVRHENRILKGDKDFHEVYEMLLAFASEQHRPFKSEVDNTSLDEYVYKVIVDETKAIQQVLGGKNVYVYPKNSFSFEKVPSSEDNFKKISVRGTIRAGNSSGRFYCANIENTNELKGCLIKVEGIGDDGFGYRYFWCPDKESGRKNGDYFQGVPKDRQDTKFVPLPNLLDFEKQFNNCVNEGGTPFSNGKKPVEFVQHVLTLQNIGLIHNAIVLDYFAGSGTTGHAVINLNRADKGNRKYILVEMGSYFDTVTKPRMQKVIYSADWKGGKPQNRNTGVSHIMKYMKLESYEDALSNVSLDDEKHGLSSLLGDDYLINYMLDVEAEGSLLKLDSFKSPFEYQLNITENNETKKKNVDVVETFNYLIGLTVKSVSAITYYKAVKDETGEYEGAVRLVKDIGGNYGFKHIEGTLPDGRKTLVIWRTISDNLIESNAALDAYLKMHRVTPTDNEYDVIYVNGDNNLKLKSSDEDGFNVKMIEIEFKKKMFEEG